MDELADLVSMVWARGGGAAAPPCEAADALGDADAGENAPAPRVRGKRTLLRAARIDENGGNGAQSSAVPALLTSSAPAACEVPYGDGGFFLPSSVHERLYEYQRDGVRWMWRTRAAGHGAILGDDMGLGKSVQVAAYVAGLFAGRHVSTVLLMVPLSIVEQWQTVLNDWAPAVPVVVFRGSKTQRRALMASLKLRGGVCIMTYGLLATSMEYVANPALRWDYVILDEGHKIKNAHIQLSQQVREIRARDRMLLSGTPMQNSVTELWALVDFVSKGLLLGSEKDFERNFAEPIVAAQDKNAADRVRAIAARLNATLWDKIGPIFLRREKASVLACGAPSGAASSDRLGAGDDGDARDNDDRDAGDGSAGAGTDDDRARAVSAGASVAPASLQHTGVANSATVAPATATLGRKTDVVVWVPLAEPQVALYREFLRGPEVYRALSRGTGGSHLLVALTAMKKICDHPLLLRREMRSTASMTSLLDVLHRMRDEEASGKMRVLLALLRELKSGGHRTLVFSQSVRVLNRVHVRLLELGMRVGRVDGSLASTAERQARIDAFNRADSDIDVFLMTTQCGGVGLTLTGADRAVIYDPAWNPSVDNQAVDRIYRIGQQRDVVVYRLVTCNTIEDKILRRQLFKASLIRTAIDQQASVRHFSLDEIRALLELGDPTTSDTCSMLNASQADPCADASAGSAPRAALESEREALRSLGAFDVTDYRAVSTAVDLEGLDAIESEDEEAASQSVMRAVEMLAHTPHAAKPKAPARTPRAQAEAALDDAPDADALNDFSLQAVRDAMARIAIDGTPPSAAVSEQARAESGRGLAQCCAAHERACSSVELMMVFRCARCRCALSPTEHEAYADLLRTADAAESRDDELDAVLRALALCSDDVRVHMRALRLVRALGLDDCLPDAAAAAAAARASTPPDDQSALLAAADTCSDATSAVAPEAPPSDENLDAAAAASAPSAPASWSSARVAGTSVRTPLADISAASKTSSPAGSPPVGRAGRRRRALSSSSSSSSSRSATSTLPARRVASGQTSGLRAARSCVAPA